MQLLKRLFLAGIAAYVLLCILALRFFKERMVLPDDANYIFELVTNGGHFAIFHQRFIAVLAQWLPFAAIRSGQMLNTVTWLYSLNLMLFYGLCYALCGFALNNFKAALAMLVSYLLFTTHTFYWTVSELGLSIAFAFLIFGILSGNAGRKKLEKNILMLILLASLTVTVAFGHGLIVFVLVYLLLFLSFDGVKNRSRLILTAAIYLLTLAIKRLFFHDSYDAHALGGLKNFVRLFPDYFRTESLHRFLEDCTGPYCWIPIVLLINCTYYIRSRNWLKLALLCCFFSGYLLLTTVAFPFIEGNGFYNENLYLPLSVFLAVPLIYDVVPENAHMLSAVAVMLIVASGILRIWYYHRPYSARLAWQRQLIQKYEGQKVILPERAFSNDTLLMSWSSPYEFWLLSTIEQKSTASILITGEPERYAAVAGNDPKVFLPTFGLFSYSYLPERYFALYDTVSFYKVVQ
jgi:hypothetical protein